LGSDRTPRCLFPARRQEYHSETEHGRQLDAALKSALPNKFIRNGCEQTSAVTTAPVRIHPTTMRQADQGFQRTIDNLARSHSAHLGDQADTAGVMVCGYMTRIHLYNVYRQ
jgi:hypothetical protein